MKPRARGILIVIAAAVVWGGCERPVPHEERAPDRKQASVSEKAAAALESSRESVATVDGVSISAGELDAAAKGQLQKLMAQVYQVKRRVLDGMIEERLIAKAAQAEGMSPEAYLAERVEAKIEPPSDEEVEAFYEQQKGRIKVPLDQMKERIADYLKSTRLQAKRQELVAALKEKADVKVMLEPPRTEVALDGAAYEIRDGEREIVLVEFSDYECPYSMKGHLTVRRILDEYGDKITYAFFDFPLAFHQNAMKAHEAARCAGDQGKYLEYARKLFDNQRHLGVEDLKKYAKELDLDVKTFDSCLESGKFSAKVQQSLEKGNLAGVSGTPAFFVNGILISGAQPFESFQEVIQAELER